MVVLALLSLLTAVVALVVAVLAWRSRRPTNDGVESDPLPQDVLGLRQEVATLRAEGRNALRNLPEGHRHIAYVAEDVYSEAGDAGQLIGEVQFERRAVTR